jgi:hypothetical protein
MTKIPSLIVYSEDIELISDDDPDERDYTGSDMIAKQDEFYGLVCKSGRNFRKVLPFIHTAIKAYQAWYEERYYLYFFILYHPNGKKGLYITPDNFSGYIFDELYLTDTDGLLGVVRNGRTGYYYYDSGPGSISEYIRYFKNNYDLDLTTLAITLRHNIMVQNKNGKWALFSYELEPQTDFVFDHPFNMTRFGTIQVKDKNNQRKEYSLNNFFKKFGI